MDDKEFLSPEEVGHLLGLTPETIREYLRRGELKGYRFGKVWRIKRTDLDKFIEERGTDKKED